MKNGASGQKASLVWLVLIGIIALIPEVFAPALGMIGLILKYIGLLLVGLLAVACVLVGYIGVTVRRLIGSVLRRPMGAARWPFSLYYCGAIFAPAISPYPILNRILQPYHPRPAILGKTVPYTLSFIKKKPLVRLSTSILRIRPRQSFGSQV